MQERLEKLVKDQDKLPIPNVEESKQGKPNALSAFNSELAKGGVTFNLDDLGIADLKSFGPFPE